MNTENLPPAAPRRGLAIASLVLGIVGIGLSLFLVGGVLGLVGVALAMAHILSKRGRNAMAWWGLGLSLVSILATIALGFAYVAFFKQVKATMATMQTGGTLASTWEGVLAPDFTVTNLEGKVTRLSDLKGKRVVLDFWATWCGPCVKEIPEFIRLQKETSRDELAIIGISDENADTLKSFVKKHGVTYAIVSAKGLPGPFHDLEAVPTTFFIDRKGVIQSIAVGARDYTQLKELALAKDFEGEVRQQPRTPPAPGLKEAVPMLHGVVAWSKTLPGARSICAGKDWDGNGATKILVGAGNQLHVLDLNGVETGVVTLPAAYATIECGQERQKGARLLGYSNWGRTVEVVDRTGKELWSYSSAMGVDGAHWGDLDGDGSDEMIVGMNGFGGLAAVSSEGKRLWHVSLGNVWSQGVAVGHGGQALVFATEAGGTIRVFDGQGHAVRTLRPAGAYFTKLAAAVVDPAGTVQVLALGQSLSGKSGLAVACDAQGQVAWSVPVSSARDWAQVHFACGDLNGDGNAEWALIEPSGDLDLVTAAGQKLAALPHQGAASDFLIVPRSNGPGLLVVLAGGSVQAFSFQ